MIAAQNPLNPFAVFEAARQNHPNPFLLEPVISAEEVWGKVMADVPDLNHHIDQIVLQEISNIKKGISKKIGIVIRGDRGTGKSHVIHRIWKNIETTGDALFSYQPPCLAPSRIDNHVRSNLCTDFAKQDIHGVTQWQKFASAIIGTLKKTEFEYQYRDYIELCCEPDQLKKRILEKVGKDDLTIFFDELTEAILENQTDLDFDFVKATLFTLFKNSKIAQVSLSWLKGIDHPQMKVAGLPEYSSAQQEDKAIWIIQQICKLAEVVSKPVIICFDQVDSYVNDCETGDGKAQVVAKCIDRLYFQCSNLILLCCTISDTWREIELMASGIPDRVGQCLVNAKPPTAEQLVQLVQMRLNWFCRQNDLDSSCLPELYPFDKEKLIQVANQAISARDFFKKWCAIQFEQSVIIPSDREKEFLEIYHELLEKVTSLIKEDDQLSAIISCTMQMMLSSTASGVVVDTVENVMNSSSHDLHLIISGYDSVSNKPVRIGVRVCETINGNSFNAVMKRLIDYQKYSITRGCLVRSTPIPMSWKKGKDLEQQLVNKLGGEVVVLQKKDIKSLVAIERIHQQSEDYGFTKDEIHELVSKLELITKNPLICEILSAPKTSI